MHTSTSSWADQYRSSKLVILSAVQLVRVTKCMIVAWSSSDATAGGGLVPDGQGDDAVPLCGSDDLAVVVNWEHDGPALDGQVIAENVSGRACRLADKPGVTPLQPDGTALPV
jgi:hypothetical protein